MIQTEQHMILSLAATIYHPGVLLKLWFPQTLVFKNSLTSPSYRSKNLPKQINTKGNKLQWSLASLSKCPSLPMKYSIKQIAIFNSIAFLLWPSHKRLRKWKKNFVFFVMEKHWCHQSGVSVFPNFDQNFNLPSQTNWKKNSLTSPWPWGMFYFPNYFLTCEITKNLFQNTFWTATSCCCWSLSLSSWYLASTIFVLSSICQKYIYILRLSTLNKSAISLQNAKFNNIL